MKKLLALLLAAAMLLAVTTALAEYWNCPTCGSQYNSTNFCPNCGTAKPAPQDDGTWACPSCGAHENTGNFCAYCGLPKPSASASVRVGDVLTVGTFEMDGNTANGNEAIEWLVLEVQGTKALCISRQGLYVSKFNKTDGGQTWATSDLRVWLNSSFLYSSFNAAELNAIQLTHLDESDRQQNPLALSKRTGADSDDMVFLLSYAEAVQYMPTAESRKCVPSRAVNAQKCYRSDVPMLNGEKTCGYWLRSPAFKNNAVVIMPDGTFETAHLRYEYMVVRPAMWVDTALLNK